MPGNVSVIQSLAISQATDICNTAARIRNSQSARNRDRAANIRETADRIAQHLNQWQGDLLCQLHSELKAYDQVGIAPSFIQIAGQRRLEKPLNKLLAWWVDPEATHGMAREFLKRLAGLIPFEALKKDLDDGLPYTFKGEKAMTDGSGNQPDLLVSTQNAALMLENKLYSGQSGDAQYKTYFDEFQSCSEFKSQEKKAILCVRDDRDHPENWDGKITHADLADILENLAQLPRYSKWDRIAATLCAVSFRGDEMAEKILYARRLEQEVASAKPSLDTITKLRQCLPLPKPLQPWD